jgi:AAA15 family ATPase/GTPase
LGLLLKEKEMKRQLKETGKIIKEEAIRYSGKINNSPKNPPYSSFEVKNFRCLQNFRMDDLGLINLIAGMNNVGKTALLEALFLHIGSTNPELALRVDRWRGHGILNEITETPWRNLFWQFQDKEAIKLISRNQKGQQRILTMTVSPAPSRILEELTAKGGSELVGTLGQSLIFNYIDESKKMLKVSGIPIFSKRGDVIRFQLRMEPSPKPSPFTGIFLTSRHQGYPEEEVQRFSDLRIKREDQIILKVLQIVEPRLESLEILSHQGISMIHGHLKDYGVPIPFPFLGDGTRRVASLFLSIGAARDGVVLVDEIENGIHHSAMRPLWEVLTEAATLFNTQVFATTHSHECVAAAHEVFKARGENDFRFHRLTRADGIVKAVTYDQESLEGALSIPLEVRG